MKTINSLLLVFLLCVLCLVKNIGSTSFIKTKLKTNISKDKTEIGNKISFQTMQSPNGQTKKCPEPKYVDNKEITSLINTLKKKKTDDDKISSIKDFISRNDGKPISAINSIKLIKNLKMNKQLPYVLGLLKDYFWITSKDMQTIMKNEKSHTFRFQIFENLYTSLLDKDIVILEDILEGFECEEKSKFKVLLEKSIPKDCFFGDLSFSKVVFIFDLSGSMNLKFKLDKTTYSRIEFLKDKFIEVFQNFNENQQYQIIIFGSNAKYLFGRSNKLIQATKKNMKNTIEKVYSLKAGGLTNIGEGLKLALSIDDNIDEIFLFSDGAPTKGIRTFRGLKNLITKQYNLRKRKNLNRPKINVNLLMLGEGESHYARKLANSFSTTIAKSTGGVVKYYAKD